MARWQPDADQRLLAAALDLFGEHGYEATTVAEIAAKAQVTERTFFRHFADKREVLFAGEEEFDQALVGAVVAAPVGASPLDLVVAALDGAGRLFGPDRRELARRRQVLIAGSAPLHERELLKLSRLTSMLAEAIAARGVDPLPARLAAELGVSVFMTAFGRWVADDGRRSLAELQTETLAEMRVLAAGG